MSLVCRCCESGNKDLVKLLLEHGADGRIHPITKYSPLYIACYYGKKDIAEIILKVRPPNYSACYSYTFFSDGKTKKTMGPSYFFELQYFLPSKIFIVHIYFGK